MRRHVSRRCVPLHLAAITLLWAAEPGLAADGRAPRLPVKAFFSNPEFSNPKFSPDGKHIAMLISAGTEDAASAIPHPTGRSVSGVP